MSADATGHAIIEDFDDAALGRIGQRVLDGLDDLVPLMGAAYRREIAEYAAMEVDDLDQVLTTSGAFVEAFARQLLAGDLHPLPDQSRLLAAGRRRQRLGISLDAAMHAFRIANREGWMAFADAAEAEAPRLVATLAARWIEYADRAATAFAEGHTTAATEQLRRMDAKRQAVVTDLLQAADLGSARAVAGTHGIRVADAYTPVVFAEGVDFLDSIASRLPAGTLTGQRGPRVVALVPVGTDPAEMFGPVAGRALVAVGRLSVPGAALRSEVVALESTIDAARAAGRMHGIVRPSELLIERVVTEHDELRSHLIATVLDPLDDADRDGIFELTAGVYMDSGSVPDTAARLHVHANTVTYRLRRVSEITGLDPRVPVEATRLHLAFVLRAHGTDGTTKEAP